ncbi:MAG: hypothetical protein HOP18_23630 [Deltaproteobacteria bacterium]|nr:hypothetical protein [Deltaproteobacteria bacterium]
MWTAKGTKDELLTRVYEHGLLRKSQALRVAVQRGLRDAIGTSKPKELNP